MGSSRAGFSLRASLLSAAGALALSSVALTALAQDATPADVPVEEGAPAATELEKVEVTGSRIKRVDIETSNPIFTIDRKMIESSGASTLGELLQATPIVTGAVTNTQVNNGGGAGTADIALRGLTSARTLVLLDGVRIISAGPTDVNSLPANMIERIEILKQGASAIYGSDAIGGVVNFITRKNFSGGEMLGGYGRTHEGDGAAYDGNITWGNSTGTGNIVAGLGYVREDEIRSPDRIATSAPFGFFFNEETPHFGTSSRVPTGRYFVSGYDCSSVTRIEGTTGSSRDDFRCFNNSFAAGPTDRYNFQPSNLALTPTRRVNAFILANQNLENGMRLYAQAFYNNTKANAQLAPEPFDNGTNFALFGRPVVISSQSMYNPFGEDISTYALRATLAGDRVQVYDTSTYQATVGLKGLLFDSYSWNTSASYGRLLQNANQTGFLNFSQLEQQLGPSYDDAEFGPSCGVEGNYRIPGCTPINIVGTDGANISSLNVTAHDRLNDELYQFAASITGDVIQLPAGPLGAAVGFEFRKEHLTFSPDALAAAFKLSEANALPTEGKTAVREVYGELNVPIWNDTFLVHSLSASLGARFSSYSRFGTTTNFKYGVEYRPYSDLLVRATYTDVFRAPTILDLYGGPAQNAPQYTDPCNGIEEAVGSDPNHDLACENVVRDGTFAANNIQASTTLSSNPNLEPEEGYAHDFGIVFNPSFYTPLTLSIDYWTYSIDKSIETLTIQTSLNGCFNNGVLCENIVRDQDGQLSAGLEPKYNVGSFMTRGIDIGFRLSYPNTNLFGMELGNFVVGADTTYLEKFDFRAIEQGNVVSAIDAAGNYDPNVFGGSFPRLRGLGYLFWNMGPWSATVNNYWVGPQREGSRYFNGFQLSVIDHADSGECEGVTGDSVDIGDGLSARCNRTIDWVSYVDVSGSYNMKEARTTFTFGIEDFFNTSSPIVVGGLNGATDTGAYRTAGRTFYTKVKYLFK
jgi:iron complex outermembrane receptor protein